MPNLNAKIRAKLQEFADVMAAAHDWPDTCMAEIGDLAQEARVLLAAKDTKDKPAPSKVPTAYYKRNSPIAGHTELTMHEAWMIDEDTGENYMLKQGWKALYEREH